MCSNFEMELVPLTEVSDHAGYSAMSALTMVQGAISSLQTICQVVAVVAWSALYQLDIKRHYAGLFYAGVAAAHGLRLLMSTTLHAREHADNKAS